MLIYLLLSAQILTPIFASLYFRRFLDAHPTALAEEIETAYTRVLLANFGGLSLGILDPSKAGFALCLMSCAWIQIDYSRALERARARKLEQPLEATPSWAHLAQLSRQIAFIGCLLALLHWFHLFGLLLFFYATPLFIRVLFSTLPMAPSPLRDQIDGIFNAAGVRLGQIRIIQSKRKNFSNAMVCGTKLGFGPFRRTLLITEHLFHRLSEEEFMAVMRHEAAHFRLHHIRKRMGAALLSQVLGLVLTIVPVLAWVSFSEWAGWKEPAANTFIGAVVYVGVLLCLNHGLFQLIRKQEHEADLEAVRLGSTEEALISALQKVTEDSGHATQKRGFIRRLILGHAHPSLEERIATIRSGILPESQFFPLHPAKLASVYAVLLVCSAFFVHSTADRQTPQREIASKGEHSAKISR